MRLALDLFCGTAGATAAFCGRSDWEVIGIDNDPRRAADVLADARKLPITGKVDFIWASPPCQEFSTMPPGSQDRRPSLDLVFATLSAVRDLRPKFWIMENVVGAIPFIGAPLQKIGPFCLWGYFPRIEAPLDVVMHRKMTGDRKTAVARAAVPRALSEAVYSAIEGAWSEPRILDMRQYRRHRHIAAARLADGRQTAAQLDGRPAPSRDGQCDWVDL